MRVSNLIAELRQQIHGDLRIEHPEWVEPNGESSMRLLEQLDVLTRRGSNESTAAAQRALETGRIAPAIESLVGKIMNWKHLLLIGRGDQVGDSFKTLADREIRERRRDERWLGEHRMTTHQLQARNSCVADARSYRVASHRFKRWLTGL